MMAPGVHRGAVYGEGDGGVAALETDVMRFMAILGFCLVAIFALVQSLPTSPAPGAPSPTAGMDGAARAIADGAVAAQAGAPGAQAPHASVAPPVERDRQTVAQARTERERRAAQAAPDAQAVRAPQAVPVSGRQAIMMAQAERDRQAQQDAQAARARQAQRDAQAERDRQAQREVQAERDRKAQQEVQAERERQAQQDAEAARARAVALVAQAEGERREARLAEAAQAAAAPPPAKTHRPAAAQRSASEAPAPAPSAEGEAAATPQTPVFTLRFASEQALLALVKAQRVRLFALDEAGAVALQAPQGASGAWSFAPAPPPAEMHDLRAGGLPALVLRAYVRERGRSAGEVRRWGVVLPAAMRTRIAALLDDPRGGEIRISAQGSVTLAPARAGVGGTQGRGG